MSLTSRYPNFLYEALKLQEPQIPIDLDSQIIQSMIDVYQQGWALAVYNHRRFDRSLGGANDIVLIGDGSFPPPNVGITEEIKQKKVIACSIEKNGGDPSQMTFSLRRIDGEVQDVIIRSFKLSEVDQEADWLTDIAGTAASTFFVPPGWQLLLSTTATGVPEDIIIVKILWAEIPAGFNIGQAG